MAWRSLGEGVSGVVDLGEGRERSVRVADAGEFDVDEDLIWAWCWDGDLLVFELC
jgi:hypothetical protein